MAASAGAKTIDVTGLDAGSVRTLEHLIQWLRHHTSHKQRHGRYEIVVGEGRVKTAHGTSSWTPETMVI